MPTSYTMAQPNQPQNLDKFFHLDSEFRSRFNAALNRDGNPLRLDLLDETGKLFELNANEVTTLFAKHLADPNTSIRVLTFESNFLAANAPRFQELRTRFNHKIGWRVLPSLYHGKTQESAALFRSDEPRLLRKPVRTAFHGYQTDEASDIASYLDFFEQAWESSEDAPPVHILGI